MTTISAAADQVRARLALSGVPASKKSIKNKLMAATQQGRSLTWAVDFLTRNPGYLASTVWVPANDPTGFEAAHRADHQVAGEAGAMPGNQLLVLA